MRRPAVLVLTPLLCALAACASSASGEPSPAASGSDADQVLLPLGAGPPFQALVQGVLRRDGQCLLIDNGQSRSVVIWPPRSRWSAADEAVVLPDERQVRLGESLSAAGGYVEPDRDRLVRIFEIRTVEDAVACARANDASIAVFNPHDSIELGAGS